MTDDRDRLAMSTMWGGGPRWTSEVASYRPDPGEMGTPRDLRRLLELAKGRPAVVLLGAAGMSHRYRDLVLAGLLKLRRGPRPRVLITDATWEPRSRALARRTGLPESFFAGLVRGVVKAIDGPHVRYAVLSTHELETFPQTWGVDRERVVFTPFPATIDPELPTRDGGYLFAGGNSLRDYDLLEDALEGAPFRTRVASRWQPRRPGGNVESGLVSHDEFVDLLTGARAAVVPLEDSVRSAGQQSYLNAMLLGKPVVVTDSPGVRDYVEHGVTGVVVPPEREALGAALRHVMDPANAQEYRRMGARARESVLAMPHYQDDVLLGLVGLPRPA